MSVALRLVPDVETGRDGRDLSPLEQWKLFMRGAGRSDRYVTDSIHTLEHLERFADVRQPPRPTIVHSSR